MTEPQPISDASLKATALLIAMGRPLAQRLVAKLNEEELRLISRAAKTLPSMNRQVVEALIEDFARSFVDQVANTTPDAEIDAILNEGLGPDAAGRLFTPPDAEKPKALWPEIAKAEPKRIAEVLNEEAETIIAAALSKLPPQVASQTLNALPAVKRASVTRCLLDLGEISKLALSVIEAELYAALNAVDPNVVQTQNRKKVATLLNGLGRDNARELLETLSVDDAASASALKAMLFDFEDVVRLDHVFRVTLFDTINPDQLIFALSGADTGLTESVLSALGARGRRMVEAELQQKTQHPAEKIEAARRLIADAALNLAEAKRISLPQAVG